MRQVPTTIVLAVLSLIIASWPGIETLGRMTSSSHYLIHCLYILSGGLFGLQTSWWSTQSNHTQVADEGGVTS
jgi:hypothetical protein